MYFMRVEKAVWGIYEMNAIMVEDIGGFLIIEKKNYLLWHNAGLARLHQNMDIILICESIEKNTLHIFTNVRLLMHLVICSSVM